MTARGDRPVALGALAGAVGGFVAALVKLGCESVVDPRPPGRLPEPEVLVNLVAHAHVATPSDAVAIHLAFSILAGALYGALVARFPRVAVGVGAGYGFAVWAGAHELVMPLIGLTPPLARLPASEQINECVTHVLWGVVLELVRHDLAGRWTAARRVARAT